MIQLIKQGWHEVMQANYSYFHTGFIHPDRMMKMHDMVYLLEGQWEIWLDETPYLLMPGHLLILPAGIHHYGKIPCKAETKTMYLHISSFPEEEALSAQTESILLPELIDCRKDKSIRRMFEELINLYWSSILYKEVELSAKVTQLFCALSRMETSPAPGVRRIEALTKVIRESPERFFTIKELAEIAHFHPRTIADEFKKVTGWTIHQYQMDLKLQMAYSEILAYPNRSFREIADAYGFYDEFHFSKSFKNKFGFSPRSLRNSAL